MLDVWIEAVERSMTKINFYVNVADQQSFLPRILKKALGEAQPLLIFARDAAAARQLDQWLWTFEELAFLPHCLADDASASETPIQITWPEGAVPHHQVLLNLAPAHPPIFSRFEKLLEIVSTDDEARTAGRERFRFYRERGYALETFDMAGK